MPLYCEQHLQEISQQFQIYGQILHAETCKIGHINETYTATYDQGGILGLASSLASLGRVVGPAWGGFLFDHFGMTVPYLSAAAMMLVAFAVSFVGLRGVDIKRVEVPG